MGVGAFSSSFQSLGTAFIMQPVFHLDARRPVLSMLACPGLFWSLIDMENDAYRPYRYRLYGFAILTVLLAVFLTVRSLNIQRTHDPICQGIAGAGFPLTFVCDTLGESPTGSWGKIDEADRWFPNPFFLIDVLFYTVLLWIPWFVVRGIAHWIRHRW